jgi:hypothetical protein
MPPLASAAVAGAKPSPEPKTLAALNADRVKQMQLGRLLDRVRDSIRR